MPERQHKIGVGTIGSAPCEISLNRILINQEDPNLTRKIMNRHNQIREGLKKLEDLKASDRGFFLSMASLFYRDQLRKFDEGRGDMPEKAYTHAMCCFRALYRRAIDKGPKKPSFSPESP